MEYRGHFLHVGHTYTIDIYNFLPHTVMELAEKYSL